MINVLSINTAKIVKIEKTLKKLVCPTLLKNTTIINVEKKTKYFVIVTKPSIKLSATTIDMSEKTINTK